MATANSHLSDDSDAAEMEKSIIQTEASGAEILYPSGMKLFVIMLSVLVTMFLVALDRLIIATAIPKISDDFHDVTSIGWYGSAYMLSNCALALLYGKCYALFNAKRIYIGAVVLFEIGSAVCGAAPNSVAFIIGRAIAGVGASGIATGSIVLMVFSVPLAKRPLYQGLFAALFGLASVTGPLLGGAFTSGPATWRWCFYINLPLGGVALAGIVFLVHIPIAAQEQARIASLSLRQKFLQLDLAGTGVFVPGIVCLLLALQWGGTTYSWSDGRNIALLVLAGVLLLAFIVVQVIMPTTATVSPRIFRHRSIYSASFASMCTGAHQMMFVYYLPIWFQAIQSVSAVESGIRTLPLVLGMVVASILSGAVTHRIGYYNPAMFFGVVLMTIGAGLLTTLEVDTPSSRWIGYQAAYGLGTGCTLQVPNLAAQTVLHPRDVPIGTALVLFFQLLGAAVFISVGQNVLSNTILTKLAGTPGFEPSFLQDNGATTLTSLPDGLRESVLAAYNEGLRHVFRVGLIMACFVAIGAAGIEWRTVKTVAKPVGGKPDANEEGDTEIVEIKAA